jgi:hypothetical protein
MVCTDDAEENVFFTVKKFTLQDITIVLQGESSNILETCDLASESK